MKPSRTYDSPEPFKQALEQRLRTSSKSGAEFARPNSRVTDLPDIALLASAQRLEASRIRAALDQTFSFRKTHALPSAVPISMASWETPYASMAFENGLAWPTLQTVTTAAKEFLDPILAGEVKAVWDPIAWSWRWFDP